MVDVRFREGGSELCYFRRIVDGLSLSNRLCATEQSLVDISDCQGRAVNLSESFLLMPATVTSPPKVASIPLPVHRR